MVYNCRLYGYDKDGKKAKFVQCIQIFVVNFFKKISQLVH